MGGIIPPAVTEGPVLTAEQQETWLVRVRVMLRLSDELNPHLQCDGGMTPAAYHVLYALADFPGTGSI